jgi:hypothetical protein
MIDSDRGGLSATPIAEFFLSYIISNLNLRLQNHQHLLGLHCLFRKLDPSLFIGYPIDLHRYIIQCTPV